MWNLTKLLLAIAPLLTSHAYAPSDAIELDIDVDNIFSSAEEMRWKRSVVGTTAPGTDAPSMDLMEDCIQPVSYIYSGEEEMIARFRGICHSICLEELNSSLEASTRQMLLGYPLWPQSFLSYKFSDDGIRGVDCILLQNPNGCRIPDVCPVALHELLVCQKGCVTRLQGVTGNCFRQCRNHCVTDCDTSLEFLNIYGCSSEWFPNPLCNTVCHKQHCKAGCQYGGNYLDRDIVYPSDNESLGVTYQPTGPPAVNHIYGTRYSVNISSAIPVNPLPYDMIINFGFTTVIIRVAGQRATRFYVLDRSTEINLDYFACQTVNVSFQVASANKGFSNFSHPLVMDVMNLEEQARCTQGSIRLQGGTNTSGIVEVCHINVWTTVCHGSNWGLADAQVACRQLGLHTTGATPMDVSAVPGDTQVSWFRDVRCEGTESSLFNCNTQVFEINCNRSRYAGVNCQDSPAPCTQGSIRLQGGTNTSGLVEICHINVWGTVCDDFGWELADAQVACRQLGLPTTGATTFTISAVPNDIRVSWLEDAGCVGNESSLFNCNTQPSEIICPIQYAGVNCRDMSPGEFPDQLNTSSVIVKVRMDDRVGFFNYHVIEVSWELPNNLQFAEGYFISMNSVSSCGQTTVYINDSTVIDHIFQVTVAERDSSAIVPPITTCFYTLNIEVIPRNVARQDEVFSIVISTGQYSNLTVDDLIVNCSSAQSITLNEYDVSLRVTYSPAFSPATIFAINSIWVYRLEYNENGQWLQNSNDATLAHRLGHIDNVTLQSSAISTLSPLDLGHSYQFVFSVSWRDGLPRENSVPPIQASCFVRDIGPIPLNPIDREDISIVSHKLFSLGEEKYRADIEFYFEFEQPGDRQVLTGFEVWFYESMAPNRVNLPVGVQRLGPLQTSGTESKTIRIQSESINLYFQLRVLTMDFISRWSTPLLLEFTTHNVWLRTITKKDFNITRFTYRTSPGGMGDVIVTVVIDIQNSIKSDNSSASLELWLGDEQLSADQVDADLDYVKDFSIVTNSIERSLRLPALGVLLYLQIRARNLAGLPGNWSSPEVIYVEEIPYPVMVDIPTLSNIMPVRNVDGVLISFSFTLEINLSIEPTDDPIILTNISNAPPIFKRRRKREAVRESGMVVSQFGIAIGFKPVEDAYGDVPSRSVEIVIPARSDAVQVSNTISLDEFDSSNSNITLFLQIRSVAGGANGMWSEPPIELVTMEVNLTEVDPLNTKLSFSQLLGIVILFSITAITLVLIATVSIFCYKQHKIRDSFKHGDGNDGAMPLWTKRVDVHFIPQASVKGKELLVDYWEIPTMEIIVENHLGEGAFGLVFKGMIQGTLRNPNVSQKLKHRIGLPIAVKLLKNTASRKERSDFLLEIDMMKKISEGCCANIVNMVGCVTIQEPFCLITEFVPHGNLLDYLRNQRQKNAARQRRLKYLRVQLEQQNQAYEEMKQKVEMLQHSQAECKSHVSGESSGYADFSDVSSTQIGGADGGDMPDEQQQGQQEQKQQQLSIARSHSSAEESQNNSLQFTNRMLGEEADDKKKNKEEGKKATLYMQTEATMKDEDIYTDVGDMDANDLIQFAYQISTGMEYLSSINVVHRDLACRNILMGNGKNLKITDFGLSRKVEDIYVKTTKEKLPLKWMALESIETREYTTKSDVWSYGITLWEIGTMGGFPYPTIQNQNLLTMIKHGYRLEKPENCAAEVYNIMLECWQEYPIDRPTFPDLRNKFSALILASTSDPYMVLEIDESKAYYTMGEEEERIFKGSEESLSSTDSIKKAKKKIEKPSWAQDASAYAPMSTTFMEGQAHIEDEQYHHNSINVTVGLEEKKHHSSTIEAGDCTDTKSITIRRSEEVSSVFSIPRLPLKQSISLHALPPTHDSLGDQVDIPLSFMTGLSEKHTAKDAHHISRSVKRTKSNSYLGDSRTLHSLEVRGEDRKNESLTSELNTKSKVAHMEDAEALTIM